MKSKLLTTLLIPFSFLIKAQTGGNVWIVAVNVYQYQDNGVLTNLDYSSSGAYEFAQLFDSRQLTMESPQILVNRRATRESILETLRSSFVTNPKLSSEDLAIFYFSGHGGMAGNDIGICPYDYSGDPRDLITDQEILNLMSSSKAKHKICFLEACKSKIVTQEIYSPNILNSFNDKRKNIKAGLAFITSSEAGKETYGIAGESGHFTKYLINGLEGAADVNKDRIVSLQEIFTFIQNGVKDSSVGKQIPQINTSGYDPLMPVIPIPESNLPQVTVPATIPVTIPKKPCETNGTGELCIVNTTGEDRWVKINNKVTPLPDNGDECFVNLKAGYLSIRVTNYLPGGGSYTLGGAYDYEVEIKQCETVRKSIR